MGKEEIFSTYRDAVCVLNWIIRKMLVIILLNQSVNWKL